MTRDILEEFANQRRAPRYPTVDAEIGLVVEERASGFCGDIVAMSFEAVTLRDRHDRFRHFRWADGAFLVDGKPVTLVRQGPVPAVPVPRLTTSGSVAVPTASRARVARAARIWVEGVHDAELIEHVWGDDMRELGIVVEPLHGIDHLTRSVAQFQPSAERRLGVLVDHLVAGSKETRVASTVRDPNVLVAGHPFVDVWAAIRPRLVGLDSWPDVPRGVPWKSAMCEALGADPRTFWPALRNRVSSYADLEPALVGAVESLIDFVTARSQPATAL